MNPPHSASNVRLTDQQRGALDRGVGSIVLSAGAGCGKTTVLAERFLQELEGDGARPLCSVVALTFTEKAARELRQRIRARCREKIEFGQAGEAAHWRTILRGLEAAPIGTFHEFCGQMLRSHAVESRIDPESVILDDSIARALRDQALRITLRAALSDQDLDLIDLAVDYGLGQIYDTLGELVGSTTRRDLETWVGQSPEQVLDLWRTLWEREGRPALLRQLSHAVRCCREALLPLNSVSPKLAARRAELLPLLDDVEAGNCPDSRLDELQQVARISDLRGKDVWPSPEIKEQIQKRLEKLREALAKTRRRLVWNPKLTEEEILSRRRLARLALKARHEYERLKEDRHGLDFDDLQLRFVELLREHPEIFNDSRRAEDRDGSMFEFILVDEFQDTDRLQSEILQRLGGSEFLNGRVFVVGDFKQSIYGFRGAEPAIFREWQETFPASGRRDLGENFRSVPGVIHFVNALYAECFGPSGTRRNQPEDRDDPPGELNRLAPMRDGLSNPRPVVEFLWADLESARSATGEATGPAKKSPRPKVKVQELRGAEAICLARHLRERLDQGWTIFDRKTKRTRFAGPGDVAFLFRAMTDVGPYESALAREGFDHHTVGGAAFFAQQEIHDVINVLSVVEDPLDEVAMAGALRSPFFSMSDNGLYWLATSFPGGLTAGLAGSESIENLSPTDRRQAIRARTLLASWRETKDRVPIAALLARILDESGYEAALVCEFLGPRKLANTRKLVSMARGFDRQGGFLVADFVAQLRAHRDDPPREEQASTSDEEGSSIRLMSIHQAKGLEFPIVVVPDLNRSSDQRNRLAATHPELGLVVRPSQAEPTEEDSNEEDDPGGGSLGWETYRAINREQEEQESLRLFYVATTRARDHLILSAGFPLDQEPKSTALRLLAERFDLKTGNCRASLPDGWPMPEVEVSIRVPPTDTETDREERSSKISHVPRKLSLDVLREAIERNLNPSVPGASLPDPTREPPPPAPLIDLNLVDGLSERSRRIDRLVRTIVNDPRLFRGESLSRIAARAAAIQVPAAHGILIREATRLLAPWLESDLFQQFRRLPEGSIRRGCEGSFAWQPEGRSATVLRGACDLMIRDPDDGWMPLVVSLGGLGQGSPLHFAACCLRLYLSARIAEGLELGPIRVGWLLDLGSRQVPHPMRIHNLGEASIEEGLALFHSAYESMYG